MGKHKDNVVCGKAIHEISKGNTEALSVIYDCMARLIFSTAYAVTGNYTDAEDVLQETMIEVIRYSSSYQEGSNARAWILAMARHRSIDIIRKRKLQIPLEAAKAVELADTSSDNSAREVFELLESLETEEKQLILYRLYAGLSYSDISEVMGASVYAVQKRYQRVLKKLKKYYE